MLKLTLGALLLGAITSANAHQPQQITETHYLVTFPDSTLEKKAKITLHHNLLADYENGVLFTLSEKEKQRLIDFGATIKPANELAAQLFQKQQSISQVFQNGTGIPGFSCYATVEETIAQVDDLVLAHPEYTELVDIGDSWRKLNGVDGYDLTVLKIGKKSLIDPPILFIQSAMHARELATAALTLDFAKKLLAERETNADINWILENQQIHILFQTNPDGRKIAERGNYQRKNTNQNHCPESNVGVDLNRNFSFGWGTVDGGSSGNSCSETYRGDAPGSEPEVASVEEYVRSIFPDQRGPNPSDAAPETTQGLYLDIHSYSQLILWPWGGTYDPAPNAVGLESLGRKLAYFNNYTPMQSVGLYPTDGTSDNLAYGELGIAHITFELGTEFFQSCALYDAWVKPKNIPALLYAAKVSKAPYMLTQGPDIIDFSLSADDENVIVNATATENRFSRTGGQLAMQAIAKVRYAINQMPTDDDSQAASFMDGNADTHTEKVTFSLPLEQLVDNKSTVYLQGQDVDGYWGPVSAYNIDLSPPVGDIVVTCSGAKCRLSSPSSNQENTFEWSVSSGENSAESEAEFILPALGDYTANLKLTNDLGITKQFTKDFSVTELLAPDVSLDYDCHHLVCEFTASNLVDQDSNDLSVSWDLGDGQTSTELNLEYTYAAAGNYTVNLTVSDEHQQATTKTVELELTAEPDPVFLPVPEEKQEKSSGSIKWLFAMLGAFVFIRRVKNKKKGAIAPFFVFVIFILFRRHRLVFAVLLLLLLLLLLLQFYF